MEVNEISSSIAAAVEEQGAATQAIARSVQEAASGTDQVSQNISGVTDASCNRCSPCLLSRRSLLPSGGSFASSKRGWPTDIPARGSYHSDRFLSLDDCG